VTDDTGVPIFRKTMTLQRFNFLLFCLRFDNYETQKDRVALDKLALIRTIFDAFVSNCRQVYSPSMYLTIDEQLIAFHGKCALRQYMPSKPSKYGLKIFALTDARCFYAINLEVYVGMQPEGPFRKSNKHEDIVLRLIEPVAKTCRNFTFDNWFTSYSLMHRLLTEHHLTSVGTVRKNKRELPRSLVSTAGRPLPSSMFGFQKQITTVSYVERKNKNVLMWSTLHHDDTIDKESGDKQKPEIVTFYNLTKGGVDALDKLSASYDIARNSRRWPLTIFYSILNTAGVDSEIVYRNNTNDFTTTRREFLKCLGKELNYRTSRKSTAKYKAS
jgi:hypothetical protein